MKHNVSVTATCSFEFVIDDEVTSERDGTTILNILAVRGKGNDLYTEDANLESLLGHLGIQLSVENRRMGNLDSWADFPVEAADGRPYSVDWQIDNVSLSPTSP